MKIKTMVKNYTLNLFFINIILGIGLITIITSCKGDQNKRSLEEALLEETIDLDFAINGKVKPGMDRIGKDISESEYNDDPMNEDYAMHVTIGDSIYFEDRSKLPAEIASQRKWYINSQLLDQNGPEVAWYSDIPANTKVTLKFGTGDQYIVQKGLVLKEDMDSFQSFMDDEAEEEIVEEKPEPIKVEKKTETKPKASYTNNTTTKKSEPVNKPSYTAPKPVVRPTIQTVDFSMDKLTAETDQGIVFRDQSTPASAVNVRVWDFGDGNNMTTKGSAVQHVYRNPGTYAIKMCLNYSSKCQKKTINITQNKNAIVVAPKPKPKETTTAVNNSTTKKTEEAKLPPKASVSKVYFSMPSKGSVGRPINIEDTSIPSSAIDSRKWYVNGKDLRLDRKKLSRTFDIAGKYEIRLCVNNSQKDCYSSIISIEEEKKVVTTPPVSGSTSSSSTEEFLCMDTKKSGIRTSQLCSSIDKTYTSKSSKIILKPSTTLELRNASIYGKSVGTIDIKLTSSDGKINRKISKAQVLPGRSIIELGELAVTLQKGVSYTLELVLPSDGSLEIENAGSCNSQFAKSEYLEINYENNIMTLMDIKFCH